MKKLIITLIICYCSSLYPLPGTITKHHQTTPIPIVSLNSLDLDSCKILQAFKAEDLPETSNWQERSDYYTNRNRTVYRTPDKKFVIKVWQSGYPSTTNFLAALNANFYENIALISALIFDTNDECRGYISPCMIDRTFKRNQWESFACVLEKGPIKVKIFSDYDSQPLNFKNLYDTLLKKVGTTGYVSLDFCPNNVAVNPHDKKMYLIDLEDVQKTSELSPFILSIFSSYLPRDYLDKVLLLSK